MSIWMHSDTGYPYGPDQSQYGTICRFCRATMHVTDIPDLWSKSGAKYEKQHRLICESSFIDDMGLRDHPDSWSLKKRSPLDIDASLSTCPACGWWSVDKRVTLAAKRQLWDHVYRADGALRSFDHTDIRAQLDEIRALVRAKYESRFDLHPRKFEELVSSVLGDLGYETALTTYSDDGGVDIVLRGRGGRIGVQVKRYRDRIKVEQLRSFMGALVLNGFVRGIFVTTSRYQSGASSLVQQAAERYVQIDLVDERRFFELLGAAQISRSDLVEEVLDLMFDDDRRPELQHVGMEHLNSL